MYEDINSLLGALASPKSLFIDMSYREESIPRHHLNRPTVIRVSTTHDLHRTVEAVT